MENELSINHEEFKDACRELIESGYISINKEGGDIYFFIVGHYDTLPQSTTVIKKANKEYEGLPNSVVEVLKEQEIFPTIEKDDSFVPPTEEEVMEYAISRGFLIDAREFIKFYTENSERLGKEGWYDGRGKKVKDWKGKIRSVWSKRAERLEEHKDAPKGFGFFCAEYEGRWIQPKGWRNGKPYGESITEDQLLLKKFNESKSNS